MTIDQERLDFLSNDAVQGFTGYVGFESVKLEPGRFISRIYLKQHHLQQDGFVHAGVIATIADHTAGYAAYTLVPPGRRILTIEYKINMLRPGKGKYIECRAQVLKPGKMILVVESEVYSVNADEEYLTAKALLTMASVPEAKLTTS